MGSTCTKEKDTQPRPSKPSTKPDHGKHKTRPLRKVRMKSRRLDSPTRRSEFFAWKSVRKLTTTISDVYLPVKMMRDEEKSMFFSAVHTWTNLSYILEEFPKKANKWDCGISGLPREVELVKSLDHPNVLRACEFLEDENSHYVVYEDFACTLEEIKMLFGPKTVDAVGKIVLQIMRALLYAHRTAVIHKNLNLSTIALKEDDLGNPSVRILRFGAPPQAFSIRTLKCSPYFHYLAPELFHSKETEKSDIWSCGVMMHVLLNGFDMMKKSHSSLVTFPKSKWETVGVEIQSLIEKMVSVDPAQRPTIEEVLRHPWIQSFDSQMSLEEHSVKLAINNLFTQKARNPLKEAVLTFVLNNVYSERSLDEMMEVFRATDSDEDGRLTYEDLSDILSRVLPESKVETSIADIMAKNDLDGNGYLTYSEFLLSAITEQEILSLENIEKTFKCLVSRESELIPVKQMKLVFFLNGPQQIVNEMWKTALNCPSIQDKNSLGLEEFEEFCLNLLDS